MQITGHNLLLTEVASDVLESMCFLGVLGPAEDASLPGEEVILCRLEFSGDGGGSFGLAAPRKIAEVIAENFLGQPTEEISRVQIEEVLCELSNMICGSFLSRLRANTIFDLTHPRCEPADAARSSVALSGNVTAQMLDLDEGSLFLWLEANA